MELKTLDFAFADKEVLSEFLDALDKLELDFIWNFHEEKNEN